VANAKTIIHAVRDATDILEAIERRAILAEASAKGANRQANRLGTSVSGRGADELTYSDTTASEAVSALATLERVQSAMSTLKQDAYRIAAELAEWAPNRPPDGDVRRCGENDCAREHHALGLCQTHYRAAQRATERRRSIQARQGGAT
jgi:hypothetical protein